MRRHGKLRGASEIGSRRAIGIDDALGQEIRDRLPVPRNVSAEDMVEGAVLADENDDVLDRSFRMPAKPSIMLRRLGDRYGNLPLQHCAQNYGAGNSLSLRLFHEASSINFTNWLSRRLIAR